MQNEKPKPRPPQPSQLPQKPQPPTGRLLKENEAPSRKR